MVAYAWVLGYSVLFVTVSAGLVVVSVLKIFNYHILNTRTISVYENVVFE